MCSIIFSVWQQASIMLYALTQIFSTTATTSRLPGYEPQRNWSMKVK